MLSEVPEIKQKALTSIDCLNVFIFNNFKKPNKKMPALFENLQTFWYTYRYMFLQLLRKLSHTILFEDHRNVWILARALHSTIVLCEMGQQTNSNNLPLQLMSSNLMDGQPQEN